MAGDTAKLTEDLEYVKLSFLSQSLHKLNVVVHTCNPDTGEVRAGRSEVQGHSHRHSF